MSDQIWVWSIIIALTIMLILKKISGSHHPVRAVMLSILWGLLAMTIVNLCSGFTGVSLPVSRLSLTVSALLGIPGVTAMLLLQTFL